MSILRVVVRVGSVMAWMLAVGCSGDGSGSAGIFAGNNYQILNSRAGQGGIALIGDSLTSGTGASQPQFTLEGCLKEKLSHLNDTWFWNFSVPGATSRDVVKTLDQYLPFDFKVAIISLGGNDVIQNRSSGTFPPEETFKNLQTIYRSLTSNGTLVLHLGLDPHQPGSERLPQIQTIASQTGVLFMPQMMQGLWGERRYMSDDIHPNDIGYRMMCDRIFTHLGQHYP